MRLNSRTEMMLDMSSTTAIEIRLRNNLARRDSLFSRIF